MFQIVCEPNALASGEVVKNPRLAPQFELERSDLNLEPLSLQLANPQ